MVIEKLIEQFVIEHYDYPKDEICSMTLQEKFSLVGMVNEKQSEEFKLALRSAGYII